MSLRMAVAPAIDHACAITVELPSGTTIDGSAMVKNQTPGGMVGLAVSFEGDAQALWDAFVDEEESTGGLWRMIGRSTRAPDNQDAARSWTERVANDELKMFTVGEHGEAYRIAFQRHGSLSPEAAGVPAAQRKTVRRVLPQPVGLRLDESSPVQMTYVAELQRGGFAGLNLDTQNINAPVLMSLAVGELNVVTKNGASVFPHFTDDELEQIAYDSFKREVLFTKPRGTPARGVPAIPRPAPIDLPPLSGDAGGERFKVGLDAVRFAQAASDAVQTRRYGDREILFHPAIWAKVTLTGGDAMVGPTLQDGDHVCVLALLGNGAPKVIRLTSSSDVELVKPPQPPTS
jgi:hypothetical protein